MIIQHESTNNKTYNVLFTWVCQWVNVNNFCDYIDEIDMRTKESYSLERNCVTVRVKEEHQLEFINALISYAQFISNVEYNDEVECDDE